MITIRSLYLQPFFQATLLRYSSHTTKPCFAYNLLTSNTFIRSIFTVAIFKHATVHKTDTITTITALSEAFIFTRLQSAECSQWGMFMLMISLSRELYCKSLCICIHTFLTVFEQFFLQRYTLLNSKLISVLLRTYCYVFIFFKTLKYNFVDCK